MKHDEIAERMLVPPGEPVKLKDFDPDWLLTKEMESLGKERAKEQSEALLEQSRRELVEAQVLLYATGTHAVLIELQGRDAAGKDGVIKHAMSGVNPQGCEVHAFKQPTIEERAHDFLWRYRRVAPPAGGSAFSTAPITKTYWSCESTPSYSERAIGSPNGRSGSTDSRQSTHWSTTWSVNGRSS